MLTTTLTRCATMNTWHSIGKVLKPSFLLFRYPYDLDWSSEAGLKCSQCESKPNSTRNELDSCYYSPRLASWLSSYTKFQIIWNLLRWRELHYMSLCSKLVSWRKLQDYWLRESWMFGTRHFYLLKIKVMFSMSQVRRLGKSHTVGSMEIDVVWKLTLVQTQR